MPRRHLAALGLLLLATACQGETAAKATADDPPTVETLSITSANARWPSNLLDGLDNDPPQVIPGRLSLPAATGGPWPAMVIIHGSGGYGRRGEEYEHLLNKAGIATLRTDSFTPRGVRTTVADQLAVTTFTMVADAFSALRVLAADPRIDPARIGIMGFSKGGSVAQLTAFEPFRRAVMGDGLKFALHIPFYRGCVYDVDMPLTGAPVRELIGGADDYVGVDGCVRFAAARKAHGDDYDITVYPGAYHGFNGTSAQFRCERCLVYVDCDWVIRADGSIFDRKLGLVASPDTSRRIVDACVRRGATIAGDPVAAAQARDFVLAFTRQVFGLTP